MDTKLDLNKLKEEIPFKWRVQSQYPKKPAKAEKFYCVAYIDSRQVQKILDDVCKPENWQNKFYELKNNLFCEIGIRTEEGWVWKGDCGNESNVEKEKGEASDAFKRAGVQWQIGRFLYEKPVIKFDAAKNGKPIYNGKELWSAEDISNACNDYLKPNKKAETPKDVIDAISGLKGITNVKQLATYGKSLPQRIREHDAFVKEAKQLNKTFL